MKSKVLKFILLTSFISCGGSGGSDSDDSAISGTWRGDLIQGVALCADGTAIGACGGCSIGRVNLEVQGGDEPGSPVFASDGDCQFEGQRNADGFTANAISGCDAGLVSLDFFLREPNVAGLAYRYDINQIPVEPGHIPCTINPSALVER